MPYIFKNPGSFNDSVNRNGLVLHPAEHIRRFERECALFRATHPDVVPAERLGVNEYVLRRQFTMALLAGEIAVNTGSYDLPVMPVLSPLEKMVLRAA